MPSWRLSHVAKKVTKPQRERPSSRHRFSVLCKETQKGDSISDGIDWSSWVSMDREEFFGFCVSTACHYGQNRDQMQGPVVGWSKAGIVCLSGTSSSGGHYHLPSDLTTTSFSTTCGGQRLVNNHSRVDAWTLHRGTEQEHGTCSFVFCPSVPVVLIWP